MLLKRKLPNLKQARLFILFYFISSAFVDTGVRRGRINAMQGSIPTQSHNP